MKVKELKEELNKYDDESIVIIQLDNTGDHAPLDTVWSGVYVATSEYYGEVLADEDIIEYGVECIILCSIY